jgi:hypothetical protein
VVVKPTSGCRVMGGGWKLAHFLFAKRMFTSFNEFLYTRCVAARLWTDINAVCLLTCFIYCVLTSSMSQPSPSKSLPTQIIEFFPTRLNLRRNCVTKCLNDSDNSTSLLDVTSCRLMITQHLLLFSSEVEKRLPLKIDSRICTQIFRSYIIKFYDVAPQKNLLRILPSQSEISALTFSHPTTDDTKI